MIAKQVYYAAQLSGLDCTDFRHALVGQRSHDPVLDVPCSEAHIFPPDGDGELIKRFESLAAPHGITRRWECKPEPGMAPNICYTVPNPRRLQMESITAELGLPMQWGILIAPKTLLNYLVPNFFCFILTGIYLATIPAPNDPQLTAGDWRSAFFDATGKATAWLDINLSSVTNERITYFNLLNRPIFFLFNGGERFKVQILRVLGDVPDSFNVMIVASGLLAPAKAYDKLCGQSTQFIKG